MTRSRTIGAAAAVLALHGLLRTGAAAALPDPLRLAIALAALILAPGWAFVALGARPPGGGWLAAGWAFGFGVAWNAVLVLIALAAGWSFLGLSPWTPLTSVLPWGLVLWRAGGRSRGVERGLSRAAVLVVLLAAALAAVHAARVGPPLGYSSDTPDHVGTLRRMLQHGELFPADAFFRDAGRAGADPRKGLWHALVALLARLAGSGPLATWRWLGALVVPLFVLNVAALGYLCRGPTGAAVAAVALVLTYGGGAGHGALREAAFATRLADQLALAATVAVLADIARGSWSTRLAAVALGFAAVAAHLFAAVQFALVLPALGAGLLLRDRRPGPEFRRLAGTALLLGLACLPYVLFRTCQACAPVDVIHTEPQGLTWLTGSLRVVSIGQLWEWMGAAWVLVPLSWPWLWARGRGRAPALYLLTSSLAVVLVLYAPPVVALLQPRLGYLLMRVIWIIPFAAILSWLLPELAAGARGPGAAPVRGAAAALLALALVLLAPSLRDAAQVARDPATVAAADRREDPRRWQAEFDWMTRRLEPDCVVLSDPATSYLIPMMTGRYVVTLADQHGSPNDPRGLARILDARDALDPYATWERTRGVVRRYGVGAIALDDRFVVPPHLGIWTPGHDWFAAARARFDAHPAAFPSLYDRGGFVVYGVRGAALDTLSAPASPRPFVEPGPAAGTGPAPGPAGRPGRTPALAGFTLASRAAAPGDSVRGLARWRGTGAATAGAWLVVLRFDRVLPAGPAVPAFLGKPARKLLERLRHERYRFRADHAPAGGRYGVDLWRAGEVVRDSFVLRVPADAAAGTYRVEARLLRDPHFANLRLSDWFFDRDSYSGVPVGTLVVRRAATRPGVNEDRP